MWKKVSFVQRDFCSLYVPSGCLLNAVCCLAEYLHSPTHCHRITKKPLPSSSDCTAGQRPKRPQLIISREGRNPQTICLVRNTAAQQMEAGLAYLKPVLFFFLFFFLIYSGASGRVRQGREKYVGVSKLSGLSCGEGSIRSSHSAECNGSRGGALGAFTSDVFPSDVGQGVCVR